MANKSSTVKINFQFDEKALKNVTGLLKNLTTVMSGLQKQTQSTNRTLDAFIRKIDKLEKSPLVQKGIKIGVVAPPKEKSATAPKTKATSTTTYTPSSTEDTQVGTPDNFEPQGLTAGLSREQQKAKDDEAEQKERDKLEQDQEKKLKDDKKSGDIAAIKNLAVINLALKVFAGVLKAASKIWETVNKLMQEGAVASATTQQTGRLARSVGMDTSTLMGYRYGMSAIAADPENANKLALMANSLNMEQRESGSVQGTEFGKLMKALGTSGAAGATDLSEGVMEAMESGDTQTIMNAILEGLAGAMEAGLDVQGIGKQFGLEDLAGMDASELQTLLSFVTKTFSNDSGSAQLNEALADREVTRYNFAQDNAEEYARIIKALDEIFKLMIPTLNSLIEVTARFLETIVDKLGIAKDFIDEQKIRSDAFETSKVGQYASSIDKNLLGFAKAGEKGKLENILADLYRSGMTELEILENVSEHEMQALMAAKRMDTYTPELQAKLLAGETVKVQGVNVTFETLVGLPE